MARPYLQFVKVYTEQEKKTMWICKPADSSRGRGIFIISDIGELEYDCNYVVQRYVDRPLLLGGYKFDLRLYVVVKSMHPLTVGGTLCLSRIHVHRYTLYIVVQSMHPGHGGYDM